MKEIGDSGDAESKGYLRALPFTPDQVIQDSWQQATPPPAEGIRVDRLVKRYWSVLLLLVLLGAGAGFISVVFSSPVYQARSILEIREPDPSFLKTPNSSSPEASELNMQTMLQILRGGAFLRRGAARLKSETVPLAPVSNDIFARLRQLIRPRTSDLPEYSRQGLALASATFDARPINHTRLIELSCESTSPQVASQFLNAMAAEFIEDTIRSRMETSQRTTVWLSQEIQETKSKLQEAEDHQQEFVRSSGNLFVGLGQETTLDDSKLVQLRGDLAKIQSDRIAKQIKSESTSKYPLEALPKVLDDANLRGYQNQINALKREKAALETTLTPDHYKVKKLDAQLTLLEATFQAEVANTVRRINGEYEAAAKQEKLLASAYATQSQRVNADAGKAARFNNLKREVETLRQMYQTLLAEANQNSLTVSVPVNPIRVVEPSDTPSQPYKPRPALNISFGMIAGLALTVGVVFLRERMDNRVDSPASIRRLLNAAELGVIPSAAIDGTQQPNRLLNLERPAEGTLGLLSGKGRNGLSPLAHNETSILAESFRETVASILRSQKLGKMIRSILVTSPGPGEGKTTVVSNLGIVLAETGRRVLLIDGDFRRPELHNRFGAVNDWGLRDLLTEQRPIEEYPLERLGMSTGIPGLFLLSNRPMELSVSKMLHSPRFHKIMDVLRKRYDMILVDAPPVLHLADTRIIAPMADGVILVLRSGVTDQASALEAHRRLREDRITLLGTVLNDWTLNKSELKSRYYYNYVHPESHG